MDKIKSISLDKKLIGMIFFFNVHLVSIYLSEILQKTCLTNHGHCSKDISKSMYKTSGCHSCDFQITVKFNQCV